MDVVGYARVSTAEQGQSGLGLAAQRQAIEDACKARKWRLVAFYEDAGVSGKKIKRPGLDRALRVVESGGAAGIVAAKVDRISRSIVDFASLMERASKKGWVLLAIDIGLDTTTPNGELVANIMASFAQFERKLIGQRTKDALAVRKAQGVRLGRPAVLDAELIADIAALRKSGLSYRRIADQLNARKVPTAHGGAQWYAGTVQKLLVGSVTTG